MYKKMFLVIFGIVLIISTVLATFGFAAFQRTESISNFDDVIVNKVNYSIFDKDHHIIGKFFYEKPYIPESFTMSKKINAYFNQDCDNFFNGTSMFFGENSFQRIKELLNEGIERWGEKNIVEQPFCYYVATKITFLSEDYISFCQTYTWAADGTRDVFNNGVTFSLTTGELVPFTDFFNIDANEFRTILSDALLPLFDDSSETIKEVIDIYGSNEDNSFEAMYYETSLHLNMNYFYDGNSVNLTLNYGLYPHNGLIFQWNNRINNTFYKKIYANFLNKEGGLYQHIY